MAGFHLPVAAKLPTSPFYAELVGSAKKLVIHQLARIDITEAPSLLPLAFRVNATTKEIVLAEQERSEMRLGGSHADTEDQRDFVDGRDAQCHATVPVRVRQHRSVGNEWLRAQNAFRLGPPDFRAPVSQLESEIAANYCFTCSYVLLRRKSSGALPHGVAVDAERRIRIDIDPRNALPLAGDGRAAQTLSL